MNKQRATELIQEYLEATYPCKCDKDDETCPGYRYEAIDIADIIYGV